jgi:thiol-disulfide isomerase/thioredoxin
MTAIWRAPRVPLVWALSLLCAIATPTRPAAAQEPATLAPRLALLDRAGKAVRLEGLRGRVVLVDFWATWCVPCRVSLPAYDDLLRQYQKQGFEVLAVNIGETRNQVDAYFRGREPLLRVLMDPKGGSSVSFRVRALPTSILVDKDGYIRSTFIGFEEGAIPRYREQIQMLLAEPPDNPDTPVFVPATSPR